MFTILLHIPTLLIDAVRAHILPRRVFISTYTPSSEGDRNAEESIRNLTRRLTSHQ